MNKYPTASNRYSSYRPNRLVDIAGNRPKLSLASEEPVQAHQPYATLSYGWEVDPPPSKHDPSQLSWERIPQLMNEIAESLLPRTYRDAIYVARRLDIRYI